MKTHPHHILVIRMSSLGDVILSTAFLESLPKEVKVDWLISQEFAFVLEGHPRIQNLIVFNKKEGLRGWVNLILRLARTPYDARVDLHVTLRSQIARLIFHWMDLSHLKWVPWKKISKQRVSFYGYLTLKRLWPKFFRPVPLWKRFAGLAQSLGGASHEPKMNHLLSVKQNEEALRFYQLSAKKYFVVMPSSRWASKEWGSDSYLKACIGIAQNEMLTPVVLGRTSDRSAMELVRGLEANEVPHRSLLSESQFAITASIIHQAQFYLGSDTGLAHLAEAVGVPAKMIFGPTRPDLGFGPWQKESVSIYSDVGCSPCSKDGRVCYRYTNRYACLKKILPEQVLAESTSKKVQGKQ